MIRYLISIFDIAIYFYVKEIRGKFESNEINEGRGKNIVAEKYIHIKIAEKSCTAKLLIYLNSKE